MTDVYIAGIGQTPVTRGQQRSVAQMAREAITRAIDDAGIESAAVAMTQNPGGMGATAITHALEAT